MWKTATDLMRKELVTVEPETTLEELLKTLDEEGVHGVPVVNAKGMPVGVVSATDVIRELVEEEDEKSVLDTTPFYQNTNEEFSIPEEWTPEIGKIDLTQTVKDIMSDRVISATESTSAGSLAAIMLEEKVHRVLITRNGRLVGMVSATDLLQLVVDQEGKELCDSKKS